MARPPLLFLHGLRGSPLGLAECAEYLKDDYTIYSPAVPPSGHEKLQHYTPDYYADWVANYIRTHQLDHPVLIGHSMGSIIAAAVAEKYPDLINHKIIFLAPITRKTFRPLATFLPVSIAIPDHLLDYVSTRYLIIPKDRATFKQVMQTTHQCSAVYVSKSDVAKSAHFSSHYSINDFNLGSKQPYFIAGTKDKLSTQEATTLTATKTGGKATFIPNSGHLVNYEKPAELAAAIRAYLEE